MKKRFHFSLSHTLSLLFLILVAFDDRLIPDGTLRRWGFVPLFFCYQDGTDVTAALSRRQLRKPLIIGGWGNPSGTALCSQLVNVKHGMNKQRGMVSNAGLCKPRTLLCACLFSFLPFLL